MNQTINRLKRIFESSLRIIRNEDKLSKEASLEELCKLLLLKFCYERKNQQSLIPAMVQLFGPNEHVQDSYRKWFYQYTLAEQFQGWDTIRVSKESFVSVLNDLKEFSFKDLKDDIYGPAFTEFLQSQYTGYLSEHSSPKTLTKFIFDVIDKAKITKLMDPCCGLGGMLAEAILPNRQFLSIAGWDTNRRMVNTVKLHMMMYGYKPDEIEQADLLSKIHTREVYDCIVAHLPRMPRQNFNIAGRRNEFFDNVVDIAEDQLIKNIVSMLNTNGITAIIVSDDLLESDARKKSRQWIRENCQILNITKFEGLTYYGGSTMNSYNVLFLRKSYSPSDDVCTATLIRTNESDERIKKAAEWVSEWVYTNSISIDDAHCKQFNFFDMNNWNVTLLFLQDMLGKKYPVVALKDILESVKVKAEIDDTAYYKQLKVRNKGMGVEERAVPVIGRDFKTKDLAFAHAGDLVVSALEADNGGIGIVPMDLDGAVVTRNYLLFNYDKNRVDADYLALVLCSDTIQGQIKLLHKHEYAMSRISISKLMAVVIPLPDLDTQCQMVKPLMQSIRKMQRIQKEMDDNLNAFNMGLFG